MAQVVLDNLGKVFRGPRGELVTALRGLSLTVAEGEFVVLVGPTGCGKSTTLRLVAGFDEPSTGTIAIGGRVVNRVEPKDRDVAMVFQNGALYPHLSVYENLALGLRLRKQPSAEIDRRVRDTAELLGLTPLLPRLPQTLSGGEAQRVAVGRAIIRQPRVFLFDEPLSHLDTPMRLQMRLELKRLHLRLSATVLYVTHDQAEAMTLGNRVAVMNGGTLHQVAEPLQLYDTPADLFVAGFIGSPPMNFARARLELASGGGSLNCRSRAEVDAGPGPAVSVPLEADRARTLQSLANREVIVGLRPEAVVPLANGDVAGRAAAVLARVELAEPLGAETLVHLDVSGWRLCGRCPARPVPRAGEVLPVRLDLAQACFFDTETGRALTPARTYPA
jgi:multiple sugar transport system ATP-binding protein